MTPRMSKVQLVSYFWSPPGGSERVSDNSVCMQLTLAYLVIVLPGEQGSTQGGC